MPKPEPVAQFIDRHLIDAADQKAAIMALGRWSDLLRDALNKRILALK